MTIHATNRFGGKDFGTAASTGIHGIHLGMGMSEWRNYTRRALEYDHIYHKYNEGGSAEDVEEFLFIFNPQ